MDSLKEKEKGTKLNLEVTEHRSKIVPWVFLAGGENLKRI